MTTIALVFDFDDILAPDSTTQFLEHNGIDAEEFWLEEFQDKVREGYDPTVAYLTLLLEKVGSDKPLGEIGTDDLEAFGASLDENETLYPGVSGLFADLNDIVADYEGIDIEYYVVSEGLESIIQGTELADNFDAVYGSRLDEDEDGVVSRVKRPISFTDKTRYLFEINKGIRPEEAKRNPYQANRRIDSEERRIPFENIIYVGDGITDVPCFSVVKERDGRVFGVIDSDQGSLKQRAVRDIGSPRRTGNLSEPHYDVDGRLGSLLRLTVEGMCTEREIDKYEVL